jgi:Protein of unknown function (DUF5672)
MLSHNINIKNNITYKEQWRNYATSLIPYIELYDLPKNITPKINDAVLIEFRELPHLYFLLKNAILKLNKYFSFKIVCGNKNYQYMKSINEKLDNICHIIKLDIDECTHKQYNELLFKKSFWELFDSEKILIYQEDSIIFHGNIEPFLKYDYIGAPWPKEKKYNEKNVGNGGFSLRTRKKMLECLYKKTNYNILNIQKNIVDYAVYNNSIYISEDIFFTNMLINKNIGVVASYEEALNFSQELEHSDNSFGGHCWWLYYENKNEKYDFNLCFSKIFNFFIEHTDKSSMI